MNTLEHIKSRLKNRAKAKFHRQHLGLEREHEVFLDWMATEIHTAYTQLSKSSDAIEKNILQKINPQLSRRPVPVDGLAHAIPEKRNLILKPGEDVFTSERMAEKPPFEIYFSPLKPTKLVAAKIGLQLTHDSFKRILDYGETREIQKTLIPSSVHPGTMWLGIELLDEKENPKDLTFHFDLSIDRNAGKQYELLPLIKWYSKEEELSTIPGMKNIFKAENNNSRCLDAEFLWLKSIEKRVVKQYEKQFVSIENEYGFLPTEVPEEIKFNIAEELRKEIDKKKFIWLKLKFPSGFSPEDFHQIKIHLNCFPVINRKLDKSKDFTPSHFGGIDICALSNADNRRSDLADSADFFLGIESIGSQKQTYQSTTFNSFQDSGPGHYALQHGRVEADDFRDILERVEELNNLIQQYSSRMLQLSGHSIKVALNHFNEGSQELNRILKDIPPQFTTSGYYLHLKALDPQDMIYVKFWLTQGELIARSLSEGDSLALNKSGVLKNDVAQLCLNY